MDVSEKERVLLGQNTEAGFTGQSVVFRNPSGEEVEILLWVKKELPGLRAHISEGNLSPEIHPKATMVRCESVRFQNLLLILLDITKELLTQGKLPLWPLMELLMEHDKDG